MFFPFPVPITVIPAPTTVIPAQAGIHPVSPPQADEAEESIKQASPKANQKATPISWKPH